MRATGRVVQGWCVSWELAVATQLVPLAASHGNHLSMGPLEHIALNHRAADHKPPSNEATIWIGAKFVEVFRLCPQVTET